MLQNLFLNQYVLSALFSDFFRNLCTHLEVPIQNQRFNRYVLFSILQQNFAIMLAQAILGEVKHAQLTTSAKQYMIDPIATDFILPAMKRANLARITLDRGEKFDEIAVTNLIG